MRNRHQTVSDFSATLHICHLTNHRGFTLGWWAFGPSRCCSKLL